MKDFTRTLAAMLCTVVMSATCVLGAVAPAEAGSGRGAVARAATFIA
jgi:hypothetical protein